MKRLQRVLWGVVPMAALFLASGWAEAKIKVDPACASDVKKLCAKEHDSATWDLTVFDCLADKTERLASECREYVGSRVACELDVGRYCDGRIFTDIRDCLGRNADNLSQSCRSQLGWAPGIERAQAQSDASDSYDYAECTCLNAVSPAAIQAQCLAGW